MATLYDILKTFKASLVANTSVDADDIVLDDQSKAESTPSIVYEFFPSKVTYNSVGNGPDRKIRDSNGNVTDYEYDEYIEVRFDVTPIADSETQLLPIYEAVRETFRPYEEWQSTHDFHTDCEFIRVEDSSSSDERELRGQSLNVFVTFTRTTSRWDTPPSTIQSVNLDQDGENYTVD